MSVGRDLIAWELEWAEYSAARYRRLKELQSKPGRWGEESEEHADLIDAFRDLEAMQPVGWWNR
jgi:hypothetical protein